MGKIVKPKAAARVRAEANNECGEAVIPAPQPSGTVKALEKALEQWPLDDDELETIEFLANSDQRKKITPWEISALLAVYRTARAVKGGGDE